MNLHFSMAQAPTSAQQKQRLLSEIAALDVQIQDLNELKKQKLKLLDKIEESLENVPRAPEKKEEPTKDKNPAKMDFGATFSNFVSKAKNAIMGKAELDKAVKQNIDFLVTVYDENYQHCLKYLQKWKLILPECNNIEKLCIRGTSEFEKSYRQLKKYKEKMEKVADDDEEIEKLNSKLRRVVLNFIDTLALVENIKYMNPFTESKKELDNWFIENECTAHSPQKKKRRLYSFILEFKEDDELPMICHFIHIEAQNAGAKKIWNSYKDEFLNQTKGKGEKKAFVKALEEDVKGQKVEDDPNFLQSLWQ